jgi:hypothetical protein
VTALDVTNRPRANKGRGLPPIKVTAAARRTPA